MYRSQEVQLVSGQEAGSFTAASCWWMQAKDVGVAASGTALQDTSPAGMRPTILMPLSCSFPATTAMMATTQALMGPRGRSHLRRGFLLPKYLIVSSIVSRHMPITYSCHTKPSMPSM